MEYRNDISHNDKLGFYRYVIIKKDDHLIIKYKTLPNGYEDTDLPDERMLISQMHIANIPAVVAAIFKVFQTKEGGSVNITEHGDKLSVDMLFNDRAQFNYLSVSDDSNRLNTELSNWFKFEFEDHIHINYPPLPRTPTPSMIWVTDTLKKIHEEWEKKQSGQG